MICEKCGIEFPDVPDGTGSKLCIECFHKSIGVGADVSTEIKPATDDQIDAIELWIDQCFNHPTWYSTVPPDNYHRLIARIRADAETIKRLTRELDAR